MNQSDEDALVNRAIAGYEANGNRDAIRLAIRAAVAHERERAAVCAWSTGMLKHNQALGMPMDARDVGSSCAAAQERIRAQDEELLAARAEAALQHNYSCEHDGGCALTDENGYRSQALKYVENYHALKAALAQEREARRAAERAIVSLATFVSELASDNRNAALTMKKHRKAIDAAIAGTK